MTYRKKLIEVALPLPEINDASAYDKLPGIGPHPKGIHHWWARLPLPTARAVLFASVVDDPSEHPEKWPSEDAQTVERERLFDILRRMMGKRLHEAPEIYAEAHSEMLKYCDGQLPAVFDPFAGGGSIPLEANRLGFEAHAGDLNPVAVLLNKCNLEFAPRWSGRPPVNSSDRQHLVSGGKWRGTFGLAADIRHYGSLVFGHVLERIGDCYPTVRLPKEKGGGDAKVIAWIWVRTVASPNPAAHGRHVPLASNFVLSTLPGRQTWIEPVFDDNCPDGWRLEVHEGVLSPERLAKVKLGTKAGKAQDFICLLTSTAIPRSYIQAEGKRGRLGQRLMAIVATDSRRKIYLSTTALHETAAFPSFNESELDEARSTFLSGPLPTRAEITGGVCSAYGLNTWAHLFTARQLTGMLTISNALIANRDEIIKDGTSAGLSLEDAESYSNAVSTVLALALDRCADFNNVLCRWVPSNQKVMNTFGRHALPMVFDYAEANIVGEGVGSWTTCYEYVAECFQVLGSETARTGYTHQADAASFAPNVSDVLVSTDPPYYNNISYATLSDFFYVWLRRTVGALHHGIFSTVLVPKLPELTAAPDRFEGSREKAKEHFESGFRSAFTSLRDVMDSRFPLTVYYAFKQDDEGVSDIEDGPVEATVDQTTGWETLLEALIASGFQITATWPVRASQKWRMVAMGTNALASYIVLACRPRAADAANVTSIQFRQELKDNLPAALRHLQQGNIAPVDFAQAAIGPGIAMYSRYSRILEIGGNSMSVRTALSLINQALAEVLSEPEGDFDAETRWAVAWFDQAGFTAGEYGVADTLSRAKNTTINSLKESGIVVARAGEVRLLRPEELADDWEPATDRPLPVWEALHYLVRALDKGETEAAKLVSELGSRAETARDLAYRLHNICERRKRVQEAQAYNGLVMSWPEISRLAREMSEIREGQTSFLDEER